MSDVDYEPGGVNFLSDRNCHDFAPDRRTGQYTTFTDLNGRTTTVRYSSLATSAAVWIFTGLTDEQTVALEQAALSPRMFGGSAHLCRAMALEVRDALNAFLDDPVEDELACEKRTPHAVIVDDEANDPDVPMPRVGNEATSRGQWTRGST